MHHELFVALLGHTGDVIEHRGDGFFVRKEVSFLSQAQCSVLNRLLRLGYAYFTLNQFVRRAASLSSVYLHALAQGVEKVLHRYADAVVELEAKILRGSTVFPLSNLMYELDEYLEVLPEVSNLVQRLENQMSNQPGPAQSVLVLRTVHQSTNSGFPRVQTTMHELLYCCHRVLFQQILTWMIHGELVDPYQEFFIKQTISPAPRDSTHASNNNNNLLLWHEQFCLDMEAVPLEYFPLSVAENIFLIGKSVHILTQANQFSPRQVQKLILLISELARRPVFDAAQVELEVEHVRRHVASQLHDHVVVKSNFVGYLRLLKDFFLLSRGEVFQTLIERTFDRMQRHPTMKSQDELNYSVWRDILREIVPENERWSREVDLELPLQTFQRTTFASTEGFVLVNAARGHNGTFLAINSALNQDESSTVWWRYPQLGDSCFSCAFSLEWEESALRCGSHRVALLLQSDDGPLSSAKLVNGSFELEDAPALYVGIDLAIEHLPGTVDGMRVMAQVKPSRAQESDVQSSPVVEVSVAEQKQKKSKFPALYVRILYARQQVASSEKQQLTYEKMMTVVVNDVVVIETPLDLDQVLELHSSVGEWFLGLAFSSFVRLTSWSLDKYKTSRMEGKTKQFTDDQRVSARELWRPLSLRTRVHWPLQLLVPPELLRSYSHLFRFCFQLKRVAYGLDLVWKSHFLRSNDTNGIVFAAGALRSRMSFVVRTLALYFHVFVIESKFQHCFEEIERTNDFERVKRVHATLVASLVKHCYVHTRTIAAALEDVVTCCWAFVEYMMEPQVWKTDERCLEQAKARILALTNDFHSRFEFLYSLLQLSEARELLFLLDSNGFFAAERERRKQQSK